ncbi:MAG TPA: hypothetical protein VFQ39_09535, partial [Longimicrobium sp.]|nr:hypothetical protein [Longimicrobium sp.]
MIVYSSRTPEIDASDALAGVRALAERVAGGGGHAEAAELLVEYGRLEAGALDACMPERDEATPLAELLRAGAMETGRILRASWRGEPFAASVDELRRVLDALGEALPRGRIPHAVPEGYAYYALYPETYLAAAARFVEEARPARAVVVGVRSIGTSLSAAVAAEVEARGCEARSFTVRPRGHPFDRRVVLGPRLAAEVERRRDAWFLVVDEGPGLSGSSFAGTAAALAELGVPNERIVFFPSWIPDGGGFVSAAARERWPRHRKVTASFEEVWTEPGRLAA